MYVSCWLGGWLTFLFAVCVANKIDNKTEFFNAAAAAASTFVVVECFQSSIFHYFQAVCVCVCCQFNLPNFHKLYSQ